MSRRFSILIIAACMSLSGFGAAVAAKDRKLHRFDPSQAPGCFDRASRNGNVTGASPTRRPRRACRRLWRKGIVKPGVHTAPRLIVCVHQPEGTAWVLPGGRAACKRVGYPVSRGPIPRN
jgi:hypothetical protein